VGTTAIVTPDPEQLQWGHSFQLGNPEEKMKRINMTGRFNGATLFSLEIPAGLRVSGGSRRLQWGHVFSDVEMSASPCSRQRMDASFNGATSFQTWKSLAGIRIQEYSHQLQWGHVFSDVEIP